MVSGKQSAGAVALATLNAIGASAASAPHCVGDNSQICFRWGVPDAAVQSGSGNVYFQLRAPTSYAWTALGIGSQMQDADIFIVYQDGAGNVTLSTRPGTGHVMPQHAERSAVELLAGSGVVGDEMVANVRCGDCTSASLTGDSGWISAWKAGEPINSRDTSARINYHDDHSSFQIDLRQAAISADSNPFTDTDQGNNNNGNGTGGGNIISGGGGSSSAASNTLLLAHGILMMIVWVILYPAGALLMPIIGKWMFHSVFQTIAFLAMWAGLGMGYVLADRFDIFWKNTHTKLGIIVCALMVLQPILGALHHMSFRRGEGRGALSHIHAWYGRALILIGIVNGGLGLQLAGTGMAFRTAYIVLSAVIAGPYFLSIPWIEFRKAKATKNHKAAAH